MLVIIVHQLDFLRIRLLGATQVLVQFQMQIIKFGNGRSPVDLLNCDFEADEVVEYLVIENHVLIYHNIL